MVGIDHYKIVGEDVRNLIITNDNDLIQSATEFLTTNDILTKIDRASMLILLNCVHLF